MAVHNWTFLLGPGLACGASAVLLASLLRRSGLVPRFIPALGLIGGPLLCASSTAVMFGIYEPISVWAAIAAVLVFAWELALVGWLITKGFNAAAIAAEPADTEPRAQLATRPA